MDRQFAIEVSTCIIAQTIESKCNCISFINDGTTIAKVKNKPLYPGQGWTPFEPVANEADTTMWEISFDTSNGGTKNSLTVARRYYKN